jgi:hypothetical protein
VTEEQQDFEAWAMAQLDEHGLPFFITKYDTGLYVDRATHSAWLAWQARAGAPKDSSLKEMQENNVWHNFRQVIPVFKAATTREWNWFANPQCKYVGLRIDMRDLGCIVMDRDGNRITPGQLVYQYKP